MTSEVTRLDPKRRNWTWSITQVVLGCVFYTWLGYRSRGRERLPEEGALFLVNHQSFLDPLLVGLALQRPVSFLARESLFRIPFIGWVLRNTYVMPIRRNSAATEALKKSIDRLVDGFYVGVFPEGTRSDDGEIGKLKPGFIAIAKRAGVPVVPIGIAGAGRAFPRNAWWLRPYRVRVVYGEPIPVDEVEKLSERGREKEFVDLVQQRLEAYHQEAEAWCLGNSEA